MNAWKPALLTTLLSLSAACAPRVAVPHARTASALQTAEAPPLPDTPAGRRLKELLDALNGRDDALLRRFVDSSAAKSAPSAEERFQRLKSLRDEKTPFALLDVLDDRRDSVTVLLRDRDGERIGLKVEIEPEPPHGIVRMRFGDPMALKDSPPPKEYTQWKSLKELISRIRADNNFPAMAVAVVKDGGVVEQAVVGVREQGRPEKVEKDDRWHIGSIGKPMTATLIALLIERGVLRWGSTLGELLPGFPMRSEYRGVTVEQLLQHRGGIPRDMGYTADYVQRVTQGADTPTAVRAAYLKDVLQRPPIAKPGERMAYSNAGYALAGFIAEKRMGQPYEQLMREVVFLPLGMKTAVVGVPPGKNEPQGHRPTPNGLAVFNFAGKLPMMTAPAGDIRCSIGDLARFAAFHLNGLRGQGRLLKPETFQRLHTPPNAPAGQERYACGWSIVGDLTPEPFHGHNGSNGTFRAELALFPKRNMAFVAAMNAGGESDPSPPLQAVLAMEKRTRN